MSEDLESKANARWHKRDPWVVTDAESGREWLVDKPLRYFLVQDKKTDEWSVCDRWLDIENYPSIRAKSKAVVIRRFLKMQGRPVTRGDSFA
ncbi:MAG: hypothetical protein WCS42_04710 [Verrucomicrobiota bacterium]